MMFSPKVSTKDNGDGTTTVTTVSYKVDGTKVIKRKTEPTRPHSPSLPENAKRSNQNSFTTVPSLEGVKQVLQEVLGVGYTDNTNFHKAVHRAIPGEFILLASQDDVTQAQEDYFAARNYGLPDNKYGQTGSVATCALLQLMNENPKRMVAGGSKPIDCRQLLHEIKTRVQKASNLESKPTISSSRPLGPPALNSNVYAPFYIVPPNYPGKRRALLIGVVGGEDEDLKGPPNDITNIQNFLERHCGFKREDIMVLRDDAHAPRAIKRSTKKNILDGFAKMVKLSKPTDVVFIQFSGHGGRLGDNLYILPSDYKQNGHILDDDILLDLIKYMPAHVHTTMLVDCCYSGVIGDLPYVLSSTTEDGDPQRIGTYYDTNTREETIQHKEQPSNDYLAKKEARSRWKNVSRLTSIAANYASEFAKDVEKGTTVFAEQARVVMEKKKAQAAMAAGGAATSARQAAANANQQYQNKKALKRSNTQPVPQNRTTTPAGKSTTKDNNVPVSGFFRNSSATQKPQEQQQARSTPSKAPLRRAQTANPSTTSSRSTPDRPTKQLEAKSTPARARSPLRRVRTGDPSSTRSPMSGVFRNPSPADKPKEAKSTRPARVPLRRVHTTTAAPSIPVARPRSPMRRKTEEDEAREFEEAARKAAVGRKEEVAQPIRSSPRRSNSLEDVAFEREVAARRAAVEQSKRDAAAAREGASARGRMGAASAHGKNESPVRGGGRRSRSAPRRCKTMEDVAMERELFARKQAVERSKREAAEARAASPSRTRGAMKDVATEKEEEARRAAVERSRKEAEEAAADREAAINTEEDARREAVERSRRERGEEESKRAAYAAGFEAGRAAYEKRAASNAEEEARQEAVERSRREREEEEARRGALEQSRREREDEEARRAARSADEEARKAAVERSRREREKEAARRAVSSVDEEARRASVERSRREKEEAVERSKRQAVDDAARRAAIERSRKEKEEEAVRKAVLSAEEAARKQAVERSRREKEEEAARRALISAEETARKEAVERSKREAAKARQQK